MVISFLVLNLFMLFALPSKPDPRLTPGEIRPLTLEDVCSTVWDRDVRHVDETMKREVATRYGLPYPTLERVEYDHLIPRELGGADSTENLWPEPWVQARTIKDLEENRYHKAVCSGSITLSVAQDYFRTWGQQ